MARVAALIIAALALAVAGAFSVLSLTCGTRESSPTDPSAPGGSPPASASRCVTLLHPMAPALVLGAALPLAAIARGGGRATALWVGGALALLTLPWSSLGLAGTLTGLLLVAAGLRVPKDAAQETAPRAPVSLALVGALMLAAFWALPRSPGDAWSQNALPLADLVAAAAILALLASRAPWAGAVAALVGGAAVIRDAVAYGSNASSDVFASAFLLAAGVAALAQSAPLNGRRAPSTPAR